MSGRDRLEREQEEISWSCLGILSSAVQFSAMLSAMKAYKGYQPRHKVLWINPAANITVSVITPETA